MDHVGVILKCASRRDDRRVIRSGAFLSIRLSARLRRAISSNSSICNMALKRNYLPEAMQ